LHFCLFIPNSVIAESVTPPWNWSGGFYKAIFYFFFIKSGRPQKSAGFIRSAGFYEVKIKNRFIKSAGPIPWYIPSCQRALAAAVHHASIHFGLLACTRLLIVSPSLFSLSLS
jgi:hypothetical protein